MDSLCILSHVVSHFLSWCSTNQTAEFVQDQRSYYMKRSPECEDGCFMYECFNAASLTSQS